MFSDMLSAEQTRWINNPHFEDKRDVHNWRNYVPNEFKLHWSSLSTVTRQVIIIMAERQSDNEEWD